MLVRMPLFVVVLSALCVGSSCVRRADDSLALPDTDTTAPKQQPPPQAISWLGAPLEPRALPNDMRVQFEAELAKAQAEFAQHPHDIDANVWLGRRLAYLGRFDEAIAVYTKAIAEHPDSAVLYRHRGHRYLTTRNLVAARDDFQRAAALIAGKPDEIEPDGLPNKKNLPRSTLHGNIWYHLGVVEFLAGDMASAEHGFRQALSVAQNDDSVVATLNWLYIILRRQGRKADADAAIASVTPTMDVIENQAYHRLLLFYRGALTIQDVTAASNDGGWKNPAIAFGVAHQWLVNGNEHGAYAQWQELTGLGRWDAFGTIAAEAELVRRNPLPRAAPKAAVVAAPPPFDLESTLAQWVASWQSYDLNAVDRLFVADARLTYYSSEKPGRMQGIDAIREHHRGFGFVPGGKAAEKQLWVENSHAEPFGTSVIVTGTWYFGVHDEAERAKAQHGPLTFVYVSTPHGYRIAHAHFAND